MALPATARAYGRWTACAIGYSPPSASTMLSVSEFHSSDSTLYSHSLPLRFERVERVEDLRHVRDVGGPRV